MKENDGLCSVLSVLSSANQSQGPGTFQKSDQISSPNFLVLKNLSLLLRLPVGAVASTMMLYRVSGLSDFRTIAYCVPSGITPRGNQWEKRHTSKILSSVTDIGRVWWPHWIVFHYGFDKRQCSWQWCRCRHPGTSPPSSQGHLCPQPEFSR